MIYVHALVFVRTDTVMSHEDYAPWVLLIVLLIIELTQIKYIHDLSGWHHIMAENLFQGDINFNAEVGSALELDRN